MIFRLILGVKFGTYCPSISKGDTGAVLTGGEQYTMFA